MILDESKIVDYEVAVGGEDLGSGEVSIDVSNMGLFYEMMSKSIYSNPIGSIVRELVSNGFDAHAEAIKEGRNPEGKVYPVVVKGFYEELDYYISFQDFGIGMNEERFKDVYLKYLSSTKRQSNDYMGCFGLGSKSPFSYSDAFYVLTRYDGTEYYYVMSKGQNAKPNWDLLYKKTTTEPNGTTIKLQIEGGKYSIDWYKFNAEIVSQLRYFDDVYVEDFAVENEYRILEYKTFKFRKDTEEQEMHIALGKVTYPIDWKTLKRPALNIPVGVKFSIGELMITSNREAIRYNDELAAFINKRIDECLEELKSLTKEASYDTIEDLRIAQLALVNGKFITLEDGIKVKVYPGNYGMDVKHEYIRYPFDLPDPKYTPFLGTPLEVPKNPFFGFRCVGFVGNTGYTSVKSEGENRRTPLPHSYNDVYAAMSNFVAFRTNDFKINKLKIAYFGTLPMVTRGFNTVIIAENKAISYGAYLKNIGLKEVVKSPYTKKLQTLPYIQDGINKLKLVKLYKKVMLKEVIKRSESYDRFQVPEVFATAYKETQKAKRVAPSEEEVLAVNISEVISGYTAKTARPLSIFKRKTVIYGANRDEGLLTAVYRLIQGRTSLKTHFNKRSNMYSTPFNVIMLNNTDLKKMEGENKIYVDKFVKHRAFIEQATAYYLIERYKELNLNWAKDYIPALDTWFSKLQSFMLKCIPNNHFTQATTQNKFVIQMMELFEKEGLFLKEYLDIMDALEAISEDLESIMLIASKANTIKRRREVASFILKKGYKVNPMYTMQLTEAEIYWINAHVKYGKKTKRTYGARELEEEQIYEASLIELTREVYEARNNKYSLYTGFTWHTNFPTFGTNKSVKISMLSLMMNP